MARALTKPTITLRGTNRISLATPSRPSAIWMTPARMIVAKQVPDAVLAHERRDDERHGAGRGRDHRGSSADERDGDGHHERAEQTDARVDARDDRERDGLGDERQRDHQAGEHFAREAAR